MILLDNKPNWISPGEDQLTADNFMNEAKSLIRRGSKVYVGTDSMVRGNNCIFVTVVAFHDNESKIAKYYYKKFKVVNSEYKNLKNKINEEVNLSVQAAQKINEFSPNTPIELHVDIGRTKENKTRVMMSSVSGWVTGMGYDLKIKPDSWASSSIADNHTK
jgi:predicted RNase H-related nuclease YkuK (DUF458 family)